MQQALRHCFSSPWKKEAPNKCTLSSIKRLTAKPPTVNAVPNQNQRRYHAYLNRFHVDRCISCRLCLYPPASIDPRSQRTRHGQDGQHRPCSFVSGVRPILGLLRHYCRRKPAFFIAPSASRPSRRLFLYESDRRGGPMFSIHAGEVVHLAVYRRIWIIRYAIEIRRRIFPRTDSFRAAPSWCRSTLPCLI